MKRTYEALLGSTQTFINIKNQNNKLLCHKIIPDSQYSPGMVVATEHHIGFKIEIRLWGTELTYWATKDNGYLIGYSRKYDTIYNKSIKLCKYE